MSIDAWRKRLFETLEKGCQPGLRSGISIGLAALFWEILKQVQDDTREGFRIGFKPPGMPWDIFVGKNV